MPHHHHENDDLDLDLTSFPLLRIDQICLHSTKTLEASKSGLFDLLQDASSSSENSLESYAKKLLPCIQNEIIKRRKQKEHDERDKDEDGEDMKREVHERVLSYLIQNDDTYGDQEVFIGVQAHSEMKMEEGLNLSSVQHVEALRGDDSTTQRRSSNFTKEKKNQSHPVHSPNLTHINRKNFNNQIYNKKKNKRKGKIKNHWYCSNTKSNDALNDEISMVQKRKQSNKKTTSTTAIPPPKLTFTVSSSGRPNLRQRAKQALDSIKSKSVISKEEQKNLQRKQEKEKRLAQIMARMKKRQDDRREMILLAKQEKKKKKERKMKEAASASAARKKKEENNEKASKVEQVQEEIDKEKKDLTNDNRDILWVESQQHEKKEEETNHKHNDSHPAIIDVVIPSSSNKILPSPFSSYSISSSTENGEINTDDIITYHQHNHYSDSSDSSSSLSEAYLVDDDDEGEEESILNTTNQTDTTTTSCVDDVQETFLNLEENDVHEESTGGEGEEQSLKVKKEQETKDADENVRDDENSFDNNDDNDSHPSSSPCMSLAMMIEEMPSSNNDCEDEEYTQREVMMDEESTTKTITAMKDNVEPLLLDDHSVVEPSQSLYNDHTSPSSSTTTSVRMEVVKVFRDDDYDDKKEERKSDERKETETYTSSTSQTEENGGRSFVAVTPKTSLMTTQIQKKNKKKTSSSFSSSYTFLEIYPQFQSLFSLASNSNTTATDTNLHAQCLYFQTKLYSSFHNVMTDYMTLLNFEREVKKEQSSSQSLSSPATKTTSPFIHTNNSNIHTNIFFKVQSSREEVTNIIRTSILNCSDNSNSNSNSKEDTRFFSNWQELPSGLGLGPCWNLLWTWSSRPKINDAEKMLKTQKINHFANARELTRKDLLKKNIERVIRGIDTRYNNHHNTTEDSLSKEFQIMPLTYVLPTEYNAFVTTFSSIQQKQKDDDQSNDNIWIMKPIGMSRGRGISLVNDIGNVSYADPIVIQKYIENPLLLRGYKFDLRVYVLVTSFSPLEAFVYREGFARFGSCKYSSDDIWDDRIHLTNSSIQKQYEMEDLDHPVLQAQEKRKKEDDDDYDINSDEEGGGNKVSLSWLWKNLDQTNMTKNDDETSYSWRASSESMWTSIKDSILKTLLCVNSQIPHQPNSFEIFGFDLMFDTSNKGKPWLIEVNSSPSLGCDTPLDRRIKTQMIRDTLKIVNPSKINRLELRNICQRRLEQMKPNERKGIPDDWRKKTSRVRKKEWKDVSRRASNRKKAEEELNDDLKDIFMGNLPRQYGEMPSDMGLFERIAPGTKIFDRLSKLIR